MRQEYKDEAAVLIRRVAQQDILVTLSSYQWRLLLSAAKMLEKKRRKEVNKSTFTPLPGKMHSGKIQVQALQAAIQTIAQEINK